MALNHYVGAKLIEQTFFLVVSLVFVYTIYKTPKLRKSPIYCSIAFALIANCVNAVIVFYCHDFPSAIIEDNFFDGVHGVISFVAMTHWFSHLLNLFLMTGYYCILLRDFRRYEKVAEYRFRALLVVLIAGAALACPFLYSEFYGFDFTVESLSWSFNQRKPAAILYKLVSWFFLLALTVIVAVAAIVMAISILRARKSSQTTDGRQETQAVDGRLWLVVAYFTLTIAYFIPVASFIVTPIWYSEEWHEYYEVADIIEDLIGGSKWLLYACSSIEFRRALKRLFPCFNQDRVQTIHIA